MLNRDFTAEAPNRVWVTDFTYVRTWSPAWVYVAFIVDVFSQRIVAWHASTSKVTDLVMTPLRMAIWQRDHEGHPVAAGELIHHSDAGSQGGFNWSSQHLDPVHRAPRTRGHRALDRLGRRRLRQRLDGDHQRALQGRVHPHHGLLRRPLQDHRHSSGSEALGTELR
jgi:transposase InsO family protein